MSKADLTTVERAQNEETMRRWFTKGWLGQNLLDRTFADRFSINGVVVGREGPRRNVRNRLIGFPDLQAAVEDLLSVRDRTVIRVRWRGTHTGPYGGVPATGNPVDIRIMTIWRFEEGLAVEDWTIQDQFAFLQQVGVIDSRYDPRVPAESTSAVGPERASTDR